MNAAARLRRDLLLAIAVPLAVSCRSAGGTATTTSSATATDPSTEAPPQTAKPTAPAASWIDVTPPKAPVPPPTHAEPGRPHFPGCPSGKLCGPASLAAIEAGEGEAKLGCPATLDPTKHPDAGGAPYRGYATLDEDMTSRRRASGDATTCCYGWMMPCGGGRPLVAQGMPRVAGLARRNDWSFSL